MNIESPATENPVPEKISIWQRLPGETAEAFEAFGLYLELGFDASLSRVAEKTGKTYGAIKNLSWRHQWSQRAVAWRQHLANTAFAGVQRDVAKNVELWSDRQQILREQEWERSQRLDMFCSEALSNLLAHPEAKVSAYELGPLLRLASQAARHAVTPPAVEDVVPDINSDPIIIEARANMAKVVEAARARQQSVPVSDEATSRNAPDGGASVPASLPQSPNSEG
jgi:hypothetical protein